MSSARLSNAVATTAESVAVVAACVACAWWMKDGGNMVAGIAERDGGLVAGSKPPPQCSAGRLWNVASSMTRRMSDHEADCSMITGEGIHSIVQRQQLHLRWYHELSCLRANQM